MGNTALLELIQAELERQLAKIISYEVIPSNAVKYFSNEGFESYLVTEGHLIALDDEGKLWHFNY